ncbi:SAG family member [Eimeria maxima]|uniref:SAG family member n=1 Tax=Eimeria maxima TaxID=5804 RepID=U6M2V4_EIMMA|nr:SAG family member [Eimeria maxima]CDJ57413.1 SAG family member [Eimeria maxima]
MTFLYKSSATVCLVALCGIQSVAADTTYKFTVENVSGDAYLAANLARNGQLPVHISEVAEANDLVASLTELISDKPITESCDDMQFGVELKKVFHEFFEYTGNNDYREVLQAALTAGLDTFKETYPQDVSKWAELWENEEFASLAYLLGSTSTRIGCVVGKCAIEETATRETGGPEDPPEDPPEEPPAKPTVTATDKAVLFCKLDPSTQENTAPFSEDYFKALIARETSLTDMTENDLQPSVELGAAPAAVPTILIAGLVAMLTTGFA